MKLKLFQVDAFASRPFEGNPAAVVPLEHWIADDLMQKIAAENNLAETAFFVQTAPGRYQLRWFTPAAEVPLCGHATLASGFVIFRFLEPALDRARFETLSGELTVSRRADGDVLSLPSASTQTFDPPSDFTAALTDALEGPSPAEFHFAAKGGAGAGTLIAVWHSAAEIKALKPGPLLEETLLRVKAASLIVTAPGDGKPYDFVSRFFAPHWGVPEDPVTGSAHGALVPFWARRLGKKQLQARQLSARGGDLLCTDDGNQVLLEGRCALYLTGEVEI
jgi:PhzF family phenazine biosynthesis protein